MRGLRQALASRGGLPSFARTFGQTADVPALGLRARWLQLGEPSLWSGHRGRGTDTGTAPPFWRSGVVDPFRYLISGPHPAGGSARAIVGR